jgi:outer membrane protein assembly factor BamB
MAADPASLDTDHYAWTPATTATATGLPSAPTTDTAIQRHGLSYSFISQGSTLLSVRNIADADGAAGTVRWRWTQPDHLSIAPPVVVQLSSGDEVVFAGASDGRLYKFNADTGRVMRTYDTRRQLGGTTICGTTPGDTIKAPVTVILSGDANADFRTAAHLARRQNDDLVIVSTSDGCGDTTHNRLIGLWASDLTPSWIFNADYAVQINALSGCAVTYEVDELTCAADKGPADTVQSTLFAVDAATGSLNWSADAGPILIRPVIVGYIVYVTSKPGSLMAYSIIGNEGHGRPEWARALQVAEPGAIVAYDMAAWPDPTPPATMIAVVDSAGTLHLVTDLGKTQSEVAYTKAEGSVRFRSAPAVFVQNSVQTYIYVGRDDGNVQQISWHFGSLTNQGAAPLDETQLRTVGDPIVDIEAGSTRLVVASEGYPGTITNLTLPLAEAPPYY